MSLSSYRVYSEITMTKERICLKIIGARDEEEILNFLFIIIIGMGYRMSNSEKIYR